MNTRRSLLRHDASYKMMTASNENIFSVTGPLSGDFMGHQRIPLTKASDAEHWCFLTICAWTYGWANSRDSGYLRQHRAHYDAIVMKYAYGIVVLYLAVVKTLVLIDSDDCAVHIPRGTVYPKKYAHDFCFVVLCCGYTLTDFPISIRLTSLALWQSNDCPSASKATLMNMDKYFMWILYERLRNHNKAKHNKTVCIFLGIYCAVLWLSMKYHRWSMVKSNNTSPQTVWIVYMFIGT